MVGLLTEIISLLGQVLNLLGVLSSAGKQTAVEPSPYAINTAVQEILAIEVDPTFGPQATRNTIDTNAALATIQYNDLVARITAVQQGTDPVILPTIPPAGYGGGGSADDIAATVWNDARWFGGDAAFTELESAGSLAENIDNYSLLPMEFSPWFLFSGRWSSPGLSGPSPTTPDPDAANIVPGDTLLSWLLREAPAFSWVLGAQGADTVSAPDLNGVGYWIAKLTATEFTILTSAHSVIPTFTAPVWPGIANVTLGTPVALSVALTVAEPMDGVLVELTSVPTPRGYYSYDGLKAYQQIGALTFISDDSDAEYIQSLGFTSAVYCPKLMTRAAAVKVRTAPGVVGTITPWVVA
jgi:hypothetical protein